MKFTLTMRSTNGSVMTERPLKSSLASASIAASAILLQSQYKKPVATYRCIKQNIFLNIWRYLIIAHLNSKHDNNGTPIEHIMHSGSWKSPSEFISVGYLSHGHNGICHRGTNIGPHDHGNSILWIQACTSKGYDDTCESGRWLHGHCAKNA